MSAINWEKVWDVMEKWYAKFEPFEKPGWVRQRKKLKSVIEEQLKKWKK